MPRNPVTFDVARSIGTKFPDVTATAGKRMALKFKGQILACEAVHKSAEPNSLMVSIGSKRRDALLAEQPAACYLTKHYERYDVILVRLSRISRTALRALLAEAWEFIRSGG